MNFSHLSNHIAGDKLPAHVALTGEGPSLVTMERMVTDAFDVPCERVYGSVDDVGDRLGALSLAGLERAYVVSGVLDHLTTHDLPWLERVLKRTVGFRTVWVGSMPESGLVRKAFTRSHVKTYDAGFGTTPAQKKIFVSWVQHISGLSLPMSEHAAKLSHYDEMTAYALAQKVALFDNVTPHHLSILVSDDVSFSFVDALLSYRLTDAMNLVNSVPVRSIPTMLSHLASMIRLLGRIYPATQKLTEPGLQASRLTGVPVPLVTAHWSVAGRYAPSDVVRKLIAISEVSSVALGQYVGTPALVELVLTW